MFNHRNYGGIVENSCSISFATVLNRNYIRIYLLRIFGIFLSLSTESATCSNQIVDLMGVGFARKSRQ